MSNPDVEIKIASDYVEEIEEKIDQLRTAQGNDNRSLQQSIGKKIEILERHIEPLTNQHRNNSEVLFYQSVVYFLRGRLVLFSDGIVNSIARESSTSKSGDFWGDLGTQLIFGMVASNEEMKTIRNAIPYYSKAIDIYDIEFYRYNRARLYWMTNDFDKALADLSGILQNVDSKYYIDSRKLQAEIEVKRNNVSNKTESSSWCFIATAVYGSSEAPEVLILRQFRGDVLSKSLMGRWFVRFYYAVSPRMAEWLSEFHRARIVLKIFVLDPIVKMIDRKGNLWR